MAALRTFAAVALTLPFALALWVLMFLAAGYGHGVYVPFVLFYAPLLVMAPMGWQAFLAAPALHVAYAGLTDVIRAGVLSSRYLIALALVHYAAVAYIGLATADGRDALLDTNPTRWRAAGPFVIVGIGVFIAWQVALARSLRRPPSMVS